MSQQNQAQQKLFRKAALEKLASPEQLDIMMEVTPPKAWLALGGLAVVVVCTIFWGIFGRINVNVQGQGILIRGASVLDMRTTTQGRISEILVDTGSIVEKGQIVARISQSGMAMRVENTRALLRDLEQQHETLKAAEAENLALSEKAIEAERRSQQKGIRDTTKQLEVLKEKVEIQRDLAERGLLTRNQLLATESQLTQTRQAISRARVRLAQLDTNLAQRRSQVSELASARETRIADMRRDLIEMESQLESSADITSPFRGRVVEMIATAGQIAGAGERLFTLEALDEPIQAVVYVPATDGKKIRTGMVARVSPSTVRVEEYGYIVGTVQDVSEFPVTPEGLRAVFNNEALIQQLTGSGAAIRVIVDLEENPETPSGFAWTSSLGPPFGVYTGTVAQGTIIVESRRPVSYVLPGVEKYVASAGS